MQKIILDTNFLLIPGTFKLDIFEEIKKIASFNYTLFIVDKTVDELNSIINEKNTKSKDKMNAKIALQLITNKKIQKIHSKDHYVDNIILKKADKDTIVATSDRDLKRRLRKKGIRIINLRKKQYLTLEQ
jgi:uncharacterized protein